MRWQFGGDFEPVITACKYDWMECPFALADYIWSEVVADVAECLANETILWRILAILLICTTVVHLIYWQIRWMKEIKRNKKNLKQVEFKVQDLELKINILTYKAQYGTWPLPHFSNKSVKTNLRNIQFTLSKLGEENSWIRHLLTRRKNKNTLSNDDPAQCQSEIKEDSNNNSTIRNVSTQLTNNDNLKSFESSSENILNYHSKYIILDPKKRVNSNIFGEISQCELDFPNYNLTTDITSLSNTSAPRFDEQILSSSTTDTEEKTDTHKTLYEVKERLEHLHLTLRKYNLKDAWTDVAHTYQNSNERNDNLNHEEINKNNNYKETNQNNNYNCFASQQQEYNYETSIGFKNSINIQNVSNIIAMYSMISNGQVPIEFIGDTSNEDHSTFEDLIETSPDEEFEIERRCNKSNTFALAKELITYKNEVKKNLSENNTTPIPDTYWIEKSMLSQNNEIAITSQKSSLAEASKESDSDDKSTCALLEEALNFQKELLSRIEFKKEESKNNVQNMTNQDGTNDYLCWQSTETHFEPKTLDMITEESSGSSSTDNRSKRNILKTLKKCKSSQNEAVHHNDENRKESNENISVPNNCSIETQFSRSKILTGEKKTNNLSNDEPSEISNNSQVKNSEESIQSSGNGNLALQIENKFVEDISKNDVCNKIEAVIEVNEDMSCQNIESLNLTTDLNLSNLTESSSDTSVNRLIDRLIESERKSKSARSSSDSKSKKELSVDSLNKLIDSHKFIESVQSENEECDHFSVESDSEKYSNFEEVKITKDNYEINNEIEAKASKIEKIDNYDLASIDTVINKNSNSGEVLKIINEEEVTYNKNECDLINDKLNLQDNSLKTKVSTLDVRFQNSESEDEKNNLFHDNDVELHHANSEHILLQFDSNTHSEQNLNKLNLSNNVEQENDKIYKDTSETKEDVNFLIFDYDEFSRKKESVDKLLNNDEPVTESENIINKKDAGDFCSDNELFMVEFQVKEENCSVSASEPITNIGINTLPSGDSNLPVTESSTFLNSPRKLKDNLYHITCKTQSSIHFSSGLKNSEQNVSRIQKNISSNTIQRQSAKSNFDLGNNRYIKAKSNLNLTLVEKISPVPTHRRSKSYVTPREISLNSKNNKVERKGSSESLAVSSKSSSRSRTPRDLENDEQSKKFEERQEGSFESLELCSKSSSKSRITVSHVETSIDEQESKFEMKRNNSFKSTLSSRSSSKSTIENQNNKGDIKRKNSIESLILSSKSSSKSCIPILKNRLEAIRKNGCDSRPRSPARGPLTLTVGGYRTEGKMEQNNESENEKFNKLMEGKEIVLVHPGDVLGLQYSNKSKQRAVVYVNMMNEDNQIASKVLDPKQFLEYIKNKELKFKNVTSEEKGDATIIDNNHLMILTNPKPAALTPLVNENNDLTNVSSLDSSTFQVQNDILKFWPCKVDSKETEVLVKPSTSDIGTSISDLPNIFNTVENKTNEFKIFEVPEELTKEEYITLLQMINENPNLEQLPNMEELCNKLGVDLQK